MSKSKKGAPPSPPQDNASASDGDDAGARAGAHPVVEEDPGCCGATPGCCGSSEPGCCRSSEPGWCSRICCSPCFLGAKIVYVIAGVFALAFIIALVVVAIAYAVALVDWSPEASGQSVGLVLVSVLVIVAVCIIIWGFVAVFKKGKAQRRNLKIIAGVLLVLAFAQLLLLVLYAAVPESSLDKSLVKSFQEARQGNPKARKSWSALQGSLECCGVVSPQDYRDNSNALFSPDVPISCCTNYNSEISELAQETGRLQCRQRKLYHRVGCMQPAEEFLSVFSSTLVGLSSTVFALLIVLTFLSWFISRQKRAKPDERAENTETTAVV